jgi:CubicO group peptidase (beta-lactamase class C family)
MQNFNSAVQYALDHEVKWTRDPKAEPDLYGVHHSDPKPWDTLLGPVYSRAGVSGVIHLNGKLVCSFGEPGKADQTFSVAKSYLALLVGKALELGKIPSLDASLTSCVPGIGFDDPHNSQITWRHLLNQTSEWAGTCFGIPDQVERFRRVVLDPKPILGNKGDPRELQKPGTYWEYNDVRINQLSLALLHIFGSELSEVFKHYFLEPLGCGENFSWEGYACSWVDLKDPATGEFKKTQSVPGGTHWGGGVRISAFDQALIGQLLLNNGIHKSNGQQKELLNSAFIKEMRTPCPIAPFYGLLTWLNPNRKTFPGASSNAYFMFGAGGNYVWIDPELNCVVVTRWIDSDFYPTFTNLIEKSIKGF